jgi:patatin-like phospholipase/acyl hydrolase
LHTAFGCCIPNRCERPRPSGARTHEYREIAVGVSMALFNIWSIDGGGIRGIIPAMILAEETRLSQALTEVLVTSYEIETCRPFFFTRRKARAQRGARLDPCMWEVARSSTAAPTAFSPA